MVSGWLARAPSGVGPATGPAIVREHGLWAASFWRMTLQTAERLITRAVAPGLRSDHEIRGRGRPAGRGGHPAMVRPALRPAEAPGRPRRHRLRDRRGLLRGVHRPRTGRPGPPHRLAAGRRPPWSPGPGPADCPA